MITVSISINGDPIFARSARNQSVIENGKTKYVTDANDVIWHDRDNGAIELAKKMLDTINVDMEHKQEN